MNWSPCRTVTMPISSPASLPFEASWRGGRRIMSLTSSLFRGWVPSTPWSWFIMRWPVARINSPYQGHLSWRSCSRTICETISGSTSARRIGLWPTVHGRRRPSSPDRLSKRYCSGGYNNSMRQRWRVRPAALWVQPSSTGPLPTLNGGSFMSLSKSLPRSAWSPQTRPLKRDSRKTSGIWFTRAERHASGKRVIEGRLSRQWLLLSTSFGIWHLNGHGCWEKEPMRVFKKARA